MQRFPTVDHCAQKEKGISVLQVTAFLDLRSALVSDRTWENHLLCGLEYYVTKFGSLVGGLIRDLSRTYYICCGKPH